MSIDENIKRNVRDLHFSQHKTICEFAKITRKSSRDIIAVLKMSGDKEKAEENKNINGINIPAPKKETGDREFDLPPNITAYRLLSEGKSLVNVTIELKLTAQQAQQFNTEYWKLIQIDHLFIIYQEVKNNLGYFLKLFRLGRKEALASEKIINLLNLADNIQDLNEQFQYHENKLKDLDLRKNQCKEQLENFENKIMSAQEQLSDTERACKYKFDELTGICSQVQMLGYKIKQFKNSQSYQAIEHAAKYKVHELLSNNKKLLEYALVSVIQALRDNPDRYLLIDKIPIADIINHNSLGTIQSTFYQRNYQFAKEKVLVLRFQIRLLHLRIVVKLAQNMIKGFGLSKNNIFFHSLVSPLWTEFFLTVMEDLVFYLRLHSVQNRNFWKDLYNQIYQYDYHSYLCHIISVEWGEQ
jgi:hypothetical protein